MDESALSTLEFSLKIPEQCLQLCRGAVWPKILQSKNVGRSGANRAIFEPEKLYFVYGQLRAPEFRNNYVYDQL